MHCTDCQVGQGRDCECRDAMGYEHRGYRLGALLIVVSWLAIGAAYIGAKLIGWF